MVDGMRSGSRVGEMDGDGSWFAKTELQTGGLGMAWLMRKQWLIDPRSETSKRHRQEV